MEGVRHFVECLCQPAWTRQLEDTDDRKTKLFHRFPVFSVIDDSGSCVEKYVKCDNCDLVHKVLEVGVSEPMKGGMTDSWSAVTKEDVSLGLGAGIKEALDRHKCDVATYEHVAWIIENSRWGESVIMTKNRQASKIEGKRLVILSSNLCKVVPFLEEM
jgi:hypothetical protein